MTYKMNSIGIIIVSFNGCEDTIECLKSIVKSDKTDIRVSILIIENGDGENAVSFEKLNNVFSKTTTLINNIVSDDAIVFEDCTTIRVFTTHYNGGFGYANNIGIKYFKEHGADICILLNNDTIIKSNFFINLLKHQIAKSKDKIAISPLSINYYNKLIDSQGYGYIDLYTGRSSHSKTHSTNYLVGSCVIMNNISSIPLFDEKFFLYCEDVDYSLQLRNDGYTLGYDDNLVIFHKVSASTSRNSKMDIIKLNSMKYLLRKRGSLANRLIFKFSRSCYYLKNLQMDLLKVLWSQN